MKYVGIYRLNGDGSSPQNVIVVTRRPNDFAQDFPHKKQKRLFGLRFSAEESVKTFGPFSRGSRTPSRRKRI